MEPKKIDNTVEMLDLPFEPRMKPAEAGKLNYKRTILISFSFLTVLLAWSYFNLKVPLLLDDILAGNQLIDLIKGSIMAMDNLIAVIMQPFFGDLSDRTKSKIGRRMPYIIIGTTLSAIFFITIPWIQVLAGLILIIFLFDFAMSIYRSTSIAILPDYISEEVYSKGSAVQQFIANMGGVIAFIIPLIVGVIPNLSEAWVDAMVFLIIGLLMLGLLAIQILKIRETPTGENLLKITKKKLEIDPNTFKAKESKKIIEKRKFKSYSEAIHIVKNQKSFKYFLITVFFMYLAFASVEAFFSSFASDFLGLYDQALIDSGGNVAEAIQLRDSRVSTLFLAYSVPMILVAFFVGMVGQNKKIGRKNAVKIFLTWMIISTIIMAFVIVPMTYKNHNAILIMLMLALISIPWMGFIVNSFPILWALAPKEKTGIYTGIYYTFNQLAYTLAPVLFGGILTIFISFGDFRYIVMFPSILLFIIIAYIIFFKVKGGEVRSELE